MNTLSWVIKGLLGSRGIVGQVRCEYENFGDILVCTGRSTAC